MDDSNEALLKRLQKLKRRVRKHDLKLKLNLFIRALELNNVHEACRRMGFGRTFYYKWWGRFKRWGFSLKALEERSRRPRKSPRKTSKAIENQILDLKATNHGPLMIHGVLKRRNILVSVPTVSHILNGRKKMHREKKKKRLNPHNKRYELPIPGQRLQMDVKYVPHAVEGKRTYTYVAVDECTRWRFAYAFQSLDQGTTVKFLEMLKAACPFPIHCIQTDNGFEFTYRLTPQMKDYIHMMDEWCERNEIIHRLIPPGVKELNGKVERSHRIDEQYFYWKATDKCLCIFNEQLGQWISDYNSKRPHGGIEFLTPLEKLQERILNLGKELLPKELQIMRTQFLQEAPVKVFTQYGSVKVKLAA